MRDLWLIEYERIADEYIRDCSRYDEEQAEKIARHSLKSLGFDPAEIDEQMSEIKA
jgi:Holliday junction resolvasome RuvABC DNA-binding subunit